MPIIRPAALLAATALLAAGCAEEAPADPDADAEPDDTAGAAVQVATAETDLGEVLVDGDGMTLYMFEPDEAGESTCYDDCAESWPPLLADGDVDADGTADADLLGTTARDDGGEQVTYDGWPLYHWAGDAEPGEVTGQGVNDVWWVLAPDGEPVRDAAPVDDGSEDDGPAGQY